MANKTSSRKSKRLSSVRLALAALEDRVVPANALNTLGENGINALGLGLTGSMVRIGQAETGRPGKPGFDVQAANVRPEIAPTSVMYTNKAATKDLAAEIRPGGSDHAANVASIMIGNWADTYTGVAPGALLYSSAITNGTEEGLETAVKVRDRTRLALREASIPGVAVNFSSGVARRLLVDDTAYGGAWLSRAVDADAFGFKRIYVVSAPNDARQAKERGLDMTFNSIKVRALKQDAAGVYRQTTLFDVSNTYKLGDRSFVEILAPGEDVFVLPQATNAQPKSTTGTSFAAPHVTGAVALLHEHVNNLIDLTPAQKVAAKHPSLMKAVLLNSADKIKDRLPAVGPITPNQALKMSRTVLNDANKDWDQDPAADIMGAPDAAARQQNALSKTLGAGALNVARAVAQINGGQYNPGNNLVGALGWDTNVLSRNGDAPPDPKSGLQNDQRVKVYHLEPLKPGSELSVTLTWAREVVPTKPRAKDPLDRQNIEEWEVVNGVRQVNLPADLQAAADHLPRNLDVYLVPAGKKSIQDAIWSSRSLAGNVEHFFVQLPAVKDVQYDLWVVGDMSTEAQGQAPTNNPMGVSQEYGMAWWGARANAGGGGGSPQSTIGDKVWSDANGNGTFDAGEAAVRDVEVSLISIATLEVVDQTRTDYLGRYLFTGVGPGDYFLRFDAPSGYGFTTPNQGGDEVNSDAVPTADGRSAFTGTVTISGFADERLDIDAGLVALPTGSVAGNLWSDDGDGSRGAGEAPVPDVVVRLLTTDGKYVAEAQTDASGHYEFSAVPVGNYLLRFDTRTNFRFTIPDAAPDGIDSDAAPTGISTSVISVTASQTAYRDAGYVAEYGSVSGRVWSDANGNGTFDAGEAGAPGVLVEVLSGSSVIVADTITDEAGDYSFDGLMPGSYTLQFSTLVSSSFSVGGPTQSVTLTAGALTQASDAGLNPTPPGSISGRAWSDANGDGLRDVGESFLGGVPVEVYDETWALVGSTTTSTTDGTYVLAGLAPGTYHVVVGDALHLADPGNGPDEAADSDFDPEWWGADVDVESGQTTANVDAGFLLNHAPVGAGDSYSVAHGGVPLTVNTASGVLTNDTDSDANPLSAVLVIAPKYGELTLHPDGSFTYLPPTWYSGEDTFAYLPTDAVGSGRFTTVTITVENGAPVGVGDAALTAQGASVSVPVLANDSDPNSDVLTVVGAWDGDHGTVSFTGTGVIYTPDADWHGTDSFVYWVVDGFGGIGSATVTVTVVPPTVITGTVWNDLDEDGRQELEGGLGGLLVFLKQNGVILATTTTLSDGSYEFTVALLDGDYYIEVEEPSGMGFTEGNALPGDDANDSDIVNTSFGMAAAFNVLSGGSFDFDAGLFVD